jgi:hypothetical protein
VFLENFCNDLRNCALLKNTLIGAMPKV